MVIEAYKYLGVLAIGIFWVSTFFMLQVWGKDHSLSISRHAATKRKAYLFFAIISTLAEPIFVLYIIKWLIPTLRLGPGFGVLFIAMAVCQLIAAWVPDSQGWKQRVHHVSAWIGGCIILASILWLGFSKYISLAPRLITIGSAVIMVGLLFGYALSPKTHRYYLVLQGTYIMVADLALLAITFIR